jgi:lipopolysaccharide exporter
VSRISMSLFNAFAYLGSLFWCAVFGSVLQLALLIPMVRHGGIEGAAYAWAIAALIEQAVLSTLTFRRFAIRTQDLLRRIWRSLMASAAMTAFLMLSGLGWAPTAPTVAANVQQLCIASLSGACAYTAILLGLWLVSGRPNGPEVDVLSVLRGVAARLYGFVSRQTALRWTTGSR